ncbi:hypothetical protein [Pedobacter sp. W3I1]|uniref:hypothetical protein n=1 Tax=Pedobacter sp. W3I1 TaxID=3042291 RepID=UPI0027D80AD9|nr:hypothetical protein [Pedobacter sp. W3I1]
MIEKPLIIIHNLQQQLNQSDTGIDLFKQRELTINCHLGIIYKKTGALKPESEDLF